MQGIKVFLADVKNARAKLMESLLGRLQNLIIRYRPSLAGTEPDDAGAQCASVSEAAGRARQSSAYGSESDGLDAGKAARRVQRFALRETQYQKMLHQAEFTRQQALFLLACGHTGTGKTVATRHIYVSSKNTFYIKVEDDLSWRELLDKIATVTYLSPPQGT